MTHASLDLTGRHIVVTGGAGALGTPVVARLVAAGATCHVPCVDDGPGSRGVSGVHYIPRVELTDEHATASLYDDLPDVWASIHLAGGFVWSKLEDTSLATVRAQLEMNAVTAFLCCREAVKKIRARKDTSVVGGRIINVSSRGGTRPDVGLSAYAMGKAAVSALTLGLAAELRAEQIWVNAVIPAIIDTPANRAAMPDADFKKWAKPADIAETILFLASPSNAVTTGAQIPVDGPTP